MNLKDEINLGQVFFITGAGASFNSGLVEPKEAIAGTCAKLLPLFATTEIDKGSVTTAKNARTRLEAAMSIQPELFYSILYDCTRTDSCLAMWRCLKKEEWGMNNYSPKPNINHLFIVKYSFEHRVPVFTMNFDPLFEEASKLLHIPFDVYNHHDSPPVGNGKLHICKLHGDISEEVTTQTICTTIDTISKRNEKWLEYIESFAKNLHICFLGYSGRDIDYFPRFCEMDIQKPFWIPVRDNVETLANSDRIGAESLSDYPDEFFSKSFPISELVDVYEESETSGKEEFLQEISDQIPDIKFDQEVFWIHLMRSTGNIRETQKCIGKVNINKLTNTEKYIFLNEEGTVYREQANFPKYRESYERIRAIAIDDGNKSERLGADFQIISSYQMTIPQEERMPWWMILHRRPILLLKVMGMFACFLRRNRNIYDGNEGIIQEALIRNLAIYIGIDDAGFIPKHLKAAAFHYYKKNCLSISDFVGGKKITATTAKETYWLEFRDLLSAAEQLGNIS